MKKKILIAIATVIVLVIPVSVFAATSDTQAAKTVRSFFGLEVSKLTDLQKSDIKDYSQKLADLQKDFINKMVSNGALTKEQGDAQISSIDEALKNGDGLTPFGLGGKGFGGRGNMKGGILGKVDTSKLTDQQKADLKAIYTKMFELEKVLVNKMVASSLLTKEQGDSAISKIESIQKEAETNSSVSCDGMMTGNLGAFSFLKGIDTSKLTNQQKTDFKDYSASMATLQKELVNKMVSFGVLTQDQGTKATARIDGMQQMQQDGSFPAGIGMRGGKSGGHGKQGGFNKGTGSSNTDSTSNSSSSSSSSI